MVKKNVIFVEITHLRCRCPNSFNCPWITSVAGLAADLQDV